MGRVAGQVARKELLKQSAVGASGQNLPGLTRQKHLGSSKYSTTDTWQVV